MMQQTTLMGAAAWQMQNDLLTAIILPEHGGKIASLVYRPKNWELLFQNPKGVFRKAERGDDYSDYEACGFDEAFPTVDACLIQVGNRKVLYPDHTGKVRSLAMCMRNNCRWKTTALSAGTISTTQASRHCRLCGCATAWSTVSRICVF